MKDVNSNNVIFFIFSVVGLDFINRLRPVTYNYDAKKLHTQKGFSEILTTQKETRYSGLLAQEVETAAQAVNYKFSGIDAPQNENDIYGLRYAEFVVPLVKSIQELSATLEEKNKEYEELKAQVKQMERLETRLKLLENDN